MSKQFRILNVGDVKMDSKKFDTDTKAGRAAYREDLQKRMAAEGISVIDDFGWKKRDPELPVELWIVLEGEQYEEGRFHGHNVIGLFRRWDDAVACIPESYKKDEGCWECDEFVWVNDMDHRCMIIEEHEIS